MVTSSEPWGGSGGGYQWPGREHGIHVDHQGNVWVSGNQCAVSTPQGSDEPVETGFEADDQLLKSTQDGEFILQIGRSNASRGNSDTRNLQRAADMFVDAETNELYVADGYGNHRVAVFDNETGAFLRMWDAFGAIPEDDDRCPSPVPDPIPGEPGPEQFSIVHAIRVSNDDLVYVADRENRRVQVFTLGGEYLTQVVRGGGRLVSLALSPDSTQRFLYVWEEGSGTLLLDRDTLDLVTVIEDDGNLGLGHLMEIDSQGNIYRAGLTDGVRKMVFTGLSLLE